MKTHMHVCVCVFESKEQIYDFYRLWPFIELKVNCIFFLPFCQLLFMAWFANEKYPFLFYSYFGIEFIHKYNLNFLFEVI